MTHIDEDAVAALTGPYRNAIPAGGRLLDLIFSGIAVWLCNFLSAAAIR